MDNSKSLPPDQIVRGTYDVIVVGAGHAGCEAALASARMGRKTLLLTMNLDSVALMPCNPSMGGPAKGHLIKEIDALGGEVGRNTDRTFIQIRLLNTSKGPAVQALRAQCDKQAYRLAMKFVLESQPDLVQQIRQMVRVVPRVKIAAADAADERAHEHLARSRVGGGEILDLEATLLENRGAHRGTPS